MSTTIGKEGTDFVFRLLKNRGYSVKEYDAKHRTTILEIDINRKTFHVIIRTSSNRRHVRLGSKESVERLKDDDFIFALMPKVDKTEIKLSPNGYELWIIPGKIAREDGLKIHESWLSEPKRDGSERKGTFGVVMKCYSRRQIQEQTCDEWKKFKNAWHLLPQS